MSGPDPSGARGQGRDDVGSVAEELTRLLGAWTDRVRAHAGPPPAGWSTDGAGTDGAGTDGAGTDAAASDGTATDGAAEPAPHLGANCRFCPLCQGLEMLRGTSPEVRAALASAAGALVLVLRDSLDQAGRAPAERVRRSAHGDRGGVERIDLAADDEHEADTGDGEGEAGPWG